MATNVIITAQYSSEPHLEDNISKGRRGPSSIRRASKAVQFSSRWCLRARKSPYALHLEINHFTEIHTRVLPPGQSFSYYHLRGYFLLVKAARRSRVEPRSRQGEEPQSSPRSSSKCCFTSTDARMTIQRQRAVAPAAPYKQTNKKGRTEGSVVRSSRDVNFVIHAFSCSSGKGALLRQ